MVPGRTADDGKTHPLKSDEACSADGPHHDALDKIAYLRSRRSVAVHPVNLELTLL
jgi:hypothetical protein